MLTAPYSIYVNKRPLRIAFLIEDKQDSLTIIDAILAHNRGRWGGRYNPIIITDGQTLSDTWWSFLEAIDPDVVKSFVTLSDELVAGIDRRVSPYLIQQPDPCKQQNDYRHLNLDDPGIRILPTASNVRVVGVPIGESSLVLFRTDRRNTDLPIKRFTEWNFGGYSDPVLAVSRALEDVRTQAYPVTDAASLVTPLTELSTLKAFTYPIQLCSVPKEALPPVRHEPFCETFHVVIGDTPSDVAYFWNRPATVPQWQRTYLSQVWLPLKVATDAQLASAFSSWLHRSAHRNSSVQGSIRFVSLSLSKDDLQQVVEPLTRGPWMSPRIDALGEIQPPNISEGFPGPPGQGKTDLHRASGTTERLTLQGPDILQGPGLDEHWMADLYIEFRPERYPTISGRQLWWQLPRPNRVTSQMFGCPSRIMRTRYPSVLMKGAEPRLCITLLDDIKVFRLLTAFPNQPCYNSDARCGKAIPGRTPYYLARRSEKGRYLSGLLERFGGLESATSVLEQRYWRRMFDLLSGRTADKDAEQLQRVGNTLRKRLRANPGQFYKDDKTMTWLTNYVLKVARSLPASSRDLPFCVFEKHAKQQMADFNARHASEKPLAYSEADLVAALQDLTERGVLLIGVQATCPSCGYGAWHHIDDAKQTLRCRGCNAAFPIPPEQPWHYRLNSLVRAAHAEHGLLPVILVLGQLLEKARSSFLFAPCLDLFENDDKGPLGDLDIPVILDGQFVIGEVKQSANLFDQATFAKMEAIARRLLPDTLLFASMDRKPTALISNEITRLSEALRPLGIKVQWYTLHRHKFDLSPVT